MSHMIFMTGFSLLMTVGMVLVIMWGMSTADPHGKGYRQDHCEFIGLRELCRESPFLIDGANGEAGACTAGVVGRKSFGDRSISPSWQRYPNAVGCFQAVAGSVVGERPRFERTHSAGWM